MKRVNGHKVLNDLIPQLAQVGDPYVTRDGRIIQPELHDLSVDDTVPSMEPKQFTASKQRSLKELPAPPKTMTGIACVFMFTTLGVQDREICEALKITREELDKIRALPAYADSFDIVMREFINVNSKILEARVSGYAHNALTTVAEVAFTGKDERNRLRASTDLLDRGGVGVKKNDANTVADGNSLRIVIHKAGETVGVEIGKVNP